MDPKPAIRNFIFSRPESALTKVNIAQCAYLRRNRYKCIPFG
jgi:hypothetical protein